MATIFDLTGMGLLPARHATPAPAAASAKHPSGLWHRLSRWIGRFGAGIAQARQRAADERECWRAYRELARLDDHLLADIGFTRAGLWAQVRNAHRCARGQHRR